MQEEQLVASLDKLLLSALDKRASDIHFEPYHNYYRIRMRIDGVLQDMLTPPFSLAKQIAARLKIMANLNIAEQRLPQDGQLMIDRYAMRISTLPVINGEKIVLRVMDNQESKLTINDLGLSADNLLSFQKLLDYPQGLILVTGPTGSGKTVTLYSGLKRLNRSDRNICSVEDPIEVPIEGINQTSVNIKAGLTFSVILRALLRQDPDVMMIGEIRDQETAEIAIQAAQTGHLVLSTLHTNSSIEALTRLNQMGIENYLLSSSLKLIIAQRLVRKLCNYCKVVSNQLIFLGDEAIPHHIATGCSHCIGGYKGRMGLYEFLVLTPEIQHQILTHQLSVPASMITLKQAGYKMIKDGITSVAELHRVLGDLYEKAL
ncbi:MULTISPECIES: GspE/PulE family protein [unclassified Gilliamella]|uniref:GspE/PulE family protein n=1 Tax=unclassified Gilliamella TaxID=2685620 RepID=UPI00226ABB1C|nr:MULTISPECIES: ATPase, T2SS/T4P/T4SS family [unclassified Gilliamella]MCX8665401.1 Flp pilus assembly complex ATPase component TadA [Gilliamella sp. B2887]MCX8698197.1 Flp pilus assembly complex ATPase component TadA [Gilliamella sp. B3000]